MNLEQVSQELKKEYDDVFAVVHREGAKNIEVAGCTEYNSTFLYNVARQALDAICRVQDQSKEEVLINFLLNLMVIDNISISSMKEILEKIVNIATEEIEGVQ